MKKVDKNKLDINVDYKKNASIYFSWLPFVGLIVSIFSALFMLVLGKEWSIMLVLYTLIPIVGFSIVSLFVYIPLRKILDFSLPFIKKKMIIITIFLVIVLVFIEIMIYVFNPKFEFEEIYLDDINTIETRINEADTTTYYILYGAQNCLYCNRMEDIYNEAFRSARVENSFYCDISQESYDDERLIVLGVQKIPILIRYKNGKEVGQLAGMRDLDDVKKFLK